MKKKQIKETNSDKTTKEETKKNKESKNERKETQKQLKSKEKLVKKERKRNQFIEKQLKKEQGILLLDKLSKSKFDSSELLLSSKKLQTLTKKEELKLQLLRERKGLEFNHSLLYPVVGDAEDGHDGDEYGVRGDATLDVGSASVDGVDQPSTVKVIKGVDLNEGIVTRAFGKPTVVETDEFGHTSVDVNNKRTITGHKRRKKKKQKVQSSNVTSVGIDVVESDSDVVPEEEKVGEVATALDAETESIDKDDNSIETTKKAYYVNVERDENIQIARMSLPVVGEEQPIMETIMNNNVTILCGETGSGKTTQVPQFLYEAGFGDPNHPLFPGLIGITQPRRVAAVSMANRVSHEMNLNNGQVTYQIRYDKAKLGRNTRIKFMTDGILLRELSSAVDGTSQKGDLLLSQYSCIIIDEAHERTVGTDILIGWLTRIVALRNSGKIKGVKPLKLVIMSATLRVEDFTQNQRLFPSLDYPTPPPIVKVDGRQHKVVIHYNKKTPELDYMSEVLKKIVKIHTRLPHGGILVFVTGQQEVQYLCKKLEKMFPKHGVQLPAGSKKFSGKSVVKGEDIDVDGGIFENDAVDGGEVNGFDDFEDLEQYSEDDDEEEEVQILNGTIDDEEVELNVPEQSSTKTPMHVLPLYSLLSTQDQLRIFEDPPEGCRTVVVATNVAETSLTIPGIRYVVDTGKVKERCFDTQTGIQNFRVGWTSSASADQRAGRAGRLGPGHCYRLFSSTVYSNFFPSFTKPEILRIPIEGVVLSMKAMGITQVVGFPFPTLPDLDRLKDAEVLLKNLDAIGDDHKITALGKIMAQFPVHPRYAKIICVAARQCVDVLPFAVAVVAGLGVGDIFYRDLDVLVDKKKDSDKESSEEDEDDKEERKQKRGKFYQKMQMFSGSSPTSDFLTMLRAIGAYLSESLRNPRNLDKFCNEHFLRPKAMEEVKKLMQQLTNQVKSSMNVDVEFSCRLPPPNARQEALLKQVILTGYGDCVAVLDDATVSGYGKHAVPMYQTMWSDASEAFVIHPSSSLFRVRPSPKWIIFDQVQSRQQMMGVDGALLNLRDKSGDSGRERKWMKIVSAINESWLYKQCKNLTNEGSILQQPEPKFEYDIGIKGYISPTFGPKFWELPICEKLIVGKEAVPWFAKSLLEGSVTGHHEATNDIFCLLQDYWEAKPSIVVKSWAKSQPKVLNLLNELGSAGISTEAQLLQKWRQQPKFLLDSIVLWIPSVLAEPLQRNWPPYKFIDDQSHRNMKLVTELKASLKKATRLYPDE